MDLNKHTPQCILKKIPTDWAWGFFFTALLKWGYNLARNPFEATGKGGLGYIVQTQDNTIKVDTSMKLGTRIHERGFIEKKLP